jgi:hypothetical protein
MYNEPHEITVQHWKGIGFILVSTLLHMLGGFSSVHILYLAVTDITKADSEYLGLKKMGVNVFGCFCS